MAWDGRYALDRIFPYGGPLDIHRYEINKGKFGQSTETYHVIHFQINDDRDLWDRLWAKAMGKRERYPVIDLYGRKSTNKNQWKLVLSFYKPWIFALLEEYESCHPPFRKWSGPAIALACDKQYNPHFTSSS